MLRPRGRPRLAAAALTTAALAAAAGTAGCAAAVAGQATSVQAATAYVPLPVTPGLTSAYLVIRNYTSRADGLAGPLSRRRIRAAFTSPAKRAVRTAELAGLAGAVPDPDLQEWDYGGYEGRTTAGIRTDRPGWYLWRDGVIPGDAEHPGESVAEVGARADAVLARVRPLLSGPDGDVALVAHGHILRVLTAR